MDAISLIVVGNTMHRKIWTLYIVRCSPFILSETFENKNSRSNVFIVSLIVEYVGQRYGNFTSSLPAEYSFATFKIDRPTMSVKFLNRMAHKFETTITWQEERIPCDKICKLHRPLAYELQFCLLFQAISSNGHVYCI